MRARMLWITAVVAVVLGGTGVAQSGERALERTLLVDVNQTGPAQVELDGDPAPESVASRRISEFEYAPRLEDDCLGARRLGRVNEHVAIEAIRVRDTPGLPFLWTSGSSGATGRINAARLHRLGPRPAGGGCPKLTTLFAYPNEPRFRLPRARRGTAAGSFSASPRVVGGELQIRTREGLYRVTDGGCCPSFVRTSDWKYDRERDRFVRTRSRTRRTAS